MAGKAGLKAGLIGAVVMAVVAIANHLLPVTGNTALTLVTCGVSSLIYIGLGVLAGYFVTPPRTPGKGAGAAAIAGLISGAATGIMGIILVVTGVSSVLDSPQMQQLIDSGMDPRVFVIPGAACNLAIGAGLAAIGGAITAAVKPD
jgi:hypothetical protein